MLLHGLTSLLLTFKVNLGMSVWEMNMCQKLLAWVTFAWK